MATAPEHVAQGSFDVPPETWRAAKEEIRTILIAKARSRAMIPYSELVGAVRAVNFTPRDRRLFEILGQVSVEEHEQGRPLLSVLVVHKTGDMQPGEGFFEWRAHW